MNDQNPRTRTFPLLPGILLGALLGAVSLTLFPRFLEVLYAASSRDWSRVAQVLISALQYAFTTPWGVIGALIGGTLAWKRLRARPESNPQTDESDDVELEPTAESIWTKSWRILPWKKLQPGEGMLSWGLVFFSLTIAATHFVMGIYFALMTGPVALSLLAVGVTRARANSAVSGRTAAGFCLLVVGFVVLSVVAFRAVAFSYELALHVHHPGVASRRYGSVPGIAEWGQFFGSCLLAPMIMAPGLKLWSDWSPTRRLIWGVVFLLFPGVAFAAHQFLATAGGPLTA